MSDVTIGPIQHSNAQCQKTGCECWCQACERHNWRHARAVSDVWATDLTNDELARLADALNRADYMNWGSLGLATMIAGTVRAIAAARLTVECPDFPHGTALRHHVDGSHSLVTVPLSYERCAECGHKLDGYGGCDSCSADREAGA